MKKLLTLIISVLLIFSLVACGSTSKTDDSSAPNNNDTTLDDKNTTADGTWKDICVNNILPEPKSKNWKVFSNEIEYLDMNVFDTTLDDYNDYIASCEDYGFEMYSYDGGVENEYNCEGYNKYHSEIYINYDAERGTMRLELDAMVENGTLEWSTSELAQMLPIPENVKGYIDADKEEKYQVVIMDVSPSDFSAYVDGCIEKGFILNAENDSTYYRAKNEAGYVVTIEYGDREMGITLKPADAE